MNILFDRLCAALNRDHYSGYYHDAPYTDYDGNTFDRAITHSFSHGIAFVIDEKGQISCSLPSGIFSLSEAMAFHLSQRTGFDWEEFFTADTAEEVLQLILNS